jgi:hypothetical protein
VSPAVIVAAIVIALCNNKNEGPDRSGP